MSNILVTGASGFLGKKVLEHLLEQGHSPIALYKDYNRKTDKELFDRVTRKGAAIHGNILDRDLVRRIVSGYELDHIIHLAAIPVVKMCDADPWTAYNVNVMGTMILMEAVRDEMIRNKRIQKIIHMSTDKSYGDSSPPGGYTEDTPFRVTDTYCTSKACGDMIAMSYAQTYKLPVCVVRCGNLYGSADLNLSRLIPGNILRLLNGEQPVLYTDAAKMLRELIHFSDLLSAYDLILVKGIPGEAYNIGTGEMHAIKDVIDLIRKKINPDITIRMVQRSFFEITEQSLNASKLNALGWEAKVGLSDGLDEAIDWYRNWLDMMNKEAVGVNK